VGPRAGLDAETRRKILCLCDKTNFMKFTTNNKTSINFNISYDNKTTEEVLTAKFAWFTK
jgi:hypothetical protein